MHDLEIKRECIWHGVTELFGGLEQPTKSSGRVCARGACTIAGSGVVAVAHHDLVVPVQAARVFGVGFFRIDVPMAVFFAVLVEAAILVAPEELALLREMRPDDRIRFWVQDHPEVMILVAMAAHAYARVDPFSEVGHRARHAYLAAIEMPERCVQSRASRSSSAAAGRERTFTWR
jgi:hypothetical protein